MNRRVRRLAAAGLLVLLTGCGSGARKPASAPTYAALPAGDVTVFAAASLTESFTAIAKSFQYTYPGVRVRLIFGPSSDLARQIVNGADADVFAAASTQSVASLTTAALADGGARVFARNRLELAVPAANRAHISGIRDIGNRGVTYAVCAVEVPCGAAAKKVLDGLGLKTEPVTFERDVKAVLAKVRLGEVDAGLVYRTDVLAEKRAGTPSKVTGLEFAEASTAVNDYPVVAVKRTGDRAAARAFVDYLLSPPAQATLTDAGFDAR